MKQELSQIIEWYALMQYSNKLITKEKYTRLKNKPLDNINELSKENLLSLCGVVSSGFYYFNIGKTDITIEADNGAKALFSLIDMHHDLINKTDKIKILKTP